LKVNSQKILAAGGAREGHRKNFIGKASSWSKISQAFLSAPLESGETVAARTETYHAVG